MAYQQVAGIPMCTNCAPLKADLFLYCCERDFRSHLLGSKRYDLIDIFNDTSRYIDDIFTFDNPEFEKYIPDIYPTEIQLKYFRQRDSIFIYCTINVFGSDVYTSVLDRRDDFE